MAETRHRQTYSSNDVEEALRDSQYSESVEPQMAGMQNETTQFRVETTNPERFIEEVEEIAYEFGATFDSGIEGNSVLLSPFEPADDVEFED